MLIFDFASSLRNELLRLLHSSQRMWFWVLCQRENIFGIYQNVLFFGISFLFSVFASIAKQSQKSHLPILEFASSFRNELLRLLHSSQRMWFWVLCQRENIFGIYQNVLFFGISFLFSVFASIAKQSQKSHLPILEFASSFRNELLRLLHFSQGRYFVGVLVDGSKIVGHN